MYLPNIEQIVISEAKTADYLLSLTHPNGHGKAKFFLAYGFTPQNWQQFASALHEHARRYEVTKIEVTPFGMRYVIEGILHTLDGRDPFVRVVWFIDTDETIPRLLTAYPRDDKDN